MPLPFDSELFGYKVGKISLPEGSVHLECDNKGYELIYLFACSQERPEALGEPVSIRVEWEKELIDNINPIDLPALISNPAISLEKLGSKVDEKDKFALERLVLTCGTYSRFNVDPYFTNQEYQKLYLTWWSNVLKGKHTVLLAKRAKEILGMITLRFGKKKAHVDLFAIMPEEQGQGLGKLLLHSAMQLARQHGMETMALSTQRDNKNAMKLYRNLGFQIQRENTIYHWRPKHTPPEPNAH